MSRFLNAINLARLGCLLVLLGSVVQLGGMKHPSKTAWARHLAEGQSPSEAEHIQVGHWYGAAARIEIATLLLLVSLAWPLSRPAPEGSSFDLRGSPIRPRAFWLGTGAVILAALLMRLPRMDHSFWGDEADAVATYIHGSYRPVDKESPDGPLRFVAPTWEQTLFSARHGPNNHVLFSILSRSCLDVWQRLSGRDATEFAEWPLRIPSLLGGLGSLVGLACLLRRWGAPVLGIAAAAFLALHPWHVRYSTEARGYALALCLMTLALIALTNALERRQWRHWLLFALLEFLLMYSWAGMAYPLAFINLAAGALILARSDRWPLLVRWSTANLIAAGAFISLYAPHLPQIRQYGATHLWIKGLPMDDIWLHNLLAAPFTGMPYHGPLRAGAATLSWERLLHQSPVVTTVGIAAIIAAFSIGLVWLWTRNRPVAMVVSSVFLAAIVAALHFKFIIGDELRIWYLVFTTPFTSLCVAAGLKWIAGGAAGVAAAPRWRIAAGCSALALAAAALWPMDRALMTYPAEDFKGAVASSRAAHETFSPGGRSNVLTCWLWRFSALYDPRGEIHVRDDASLRQRMEIARSANKTLFVILGYRSLAQSGTPEMVRTLEDPHFFEKVAAFPGYDPIQTLEVFRMNPPQHATAATH